jgi:hypothetical protein
VVRGAILVTELERPHPERSGDLGGEPGRGRRRARDRAAATAKGLGAPRVALAREGLEGVHRE